MLQFTVAQLWNTFNTWRIHSRYVYENRSTTTNNDNLGMYGCINMYEVKKSVLLCNDTPYEICTKQMGCDMWFYMRAHSTSDTYRSLGGWAGIIWKEVWCCLFSKITLYIETLRYSWMQHDLYIFWWIICRLSLSSLERIKNSPYISRDINIRSSPNNGVRAQSLWNIAL